MGLMGLGVGANAFGKNFRDTYLAIEENKRMKAQQKLQEQLLQMRLKEYETKQAREQGLMQAYEDAKTPGMDEEDAFMQIANNPVAWGQPDARGVQDITPQGQGMLDTAMAPQFDQNKYFQNAMKYMTPGELVQMQNKDKGLEAMYERLLLGQQFKESEKEKDRAFQKERDEFKADAQYNLRMTLAAMRQNNGGGSSAEDKKTERAEKWLNTYDKQAYSQAAKETALKFPKDVSFSIGADGAVSVNAKPGADASNALNYFSERKTQLLNDKLGGAVKRGIIPKDWVESGSTPSQGQTQTAQKMSGYEGLMREAQDAIAKGADKGKVRARLKKMGYSDKQLDDPYFDWLR
jgi:hypothetical protein